MSTLTDRVVAASEGRDRVIDAAKALALLLVVVGHSLAWNIQPDNTVTNTLEVAPNLYPLTWILQILPIFFFLAGNGMVKYAQQPSAQGLLARATRLATPTLPLLLVTFLIAGALSYAGSDIANAAGTLPTQLLWFIGVYLIALTLAPALARINKLWQYALYLGLIALVDVLRIYVSPGLGWINLVLVWMLFVSAGMSLTRWRRLPKTLLLGLAALFASAAAATVALGPYSVALITTNAHPGLSNLAPPTLVLAFVGLAQICFLLAIWDIAARILTHNKIWVPIAIFSTRAIGIYLWHMLILAIFIALNIAFAWHPPPLSLEWWAIHIAVFLALLATVWFTTPPLLAAGNILAGTLGTLTPANKAAALLQKQSSTLPAVGITLLAALTYLLISESGLANPLVLRTVIIFPYLPALALFYIAAIIAINQKQKPQPTRKKK